MILQIDYEKDTINTFDAYTLLVSYNIDRRVQKAFKKYINVAFCPYSKLLEFIALHWLMTSNLDLSKEDLIEACNRYKPKKKNKQKYNYIKYLYSLKDNNWLLQYSLKRYKARDFNQFWTTKLWVLTNWKRTYLIEQIKKLSLEHDLRRTDSK